MQTSMTTGSPAKSIVSFTLPVLAGNLLQLTYSIADTRIVGTYLGDHALAAVGATTVLNSLYIGFFMGIANGFAILTARFYGAANEQKVRCSFAAAFMLGSILAVLLAGLTLLFLSPVLHFLNVPDVLFAEARSYVSIIIGGLLITMLYDIFLASARAAGDSVTPLLILILSVGLNILGDLLLLGVLHTGVWGAAAATVGAQAIALLISALYILRKYAFFRIGFRDFRKITGRLIREMLATGISMGLMSSLINLGSMILQTAINGLSSSYIVAQSTARKITEVLMSVFVAFGHTMATYCSQNLGAGEHERIRRGMKAGCIITCSWCLVVFLIVWPFSSILVQLITGSRDAVMIRAATEYLRIDSVLYVLVALIFIFRNSLQGLGDRITPLISSGIEMGGKVVLTYTLVPALGYFGVILVEPIVWIVMILPLIVRIKRYVQSDFF